ncbi:hypothetical protein A8M40_11345 [Escherichia coli]|uniref:hypothetical protein n=1 Tax=Escherichia coli TaxID=562 RepID=UPI000B429CB1|nr:hypothetical protein [Escherichia coli]EFH3744922.1 hypothetical protein [Escherichia coli]EHD5842927.1 hypothetical protein [Escherichia coli]EID6773264.1 hypothetical protein [Escherichia coli]EKO0566010.1 hypothetical protein [Escherichia coli]EKP8508237.1 hypothetical protein [Escherichia coli]
MSDRLLIAVLGNRNSGKSTTWYKLFGQMVSTGKRERPLHLNANQTVNVFLINGSPQERKVDVIDILPTPLPQIVLCSTQYREEVKETFDYFIQEGYEIFVQWLNPGYRDNDSYGDHLALKEYLLEKGATLVTRNGKADPALRADEIRQFILEWATCRNLISSKK